MAVLRNGIETDKFQPVPIPDNDKPVIAIIGRLSGPGGALLPVAGRGAGSGSLPGARRQRHPGAGAFARFGDKVDFVGMWTMCPPLMAGCDLVMGAGRVAMEALLCGRPAFAIGEARAIGLVTEQNLDEASPATSATSAPGSGHRLCRAEGADPSALASKVVPDPVRQRILQEYDLQGVVTGLESVYQDAVVETLRREMPVIMYHRFIEHESEKGVHGTWPRSPCSRSTLKLMKWLGYETLTFADLAENGFIHRLQYGKKYLMITVDDGYRDNLTRMLPLLESMAARRWSMW